MRNTRLPTRVVLLALGLLTPANTGATVLFSKKIGRATLEQLLLHDWSLSHSFPERGMTVQIYQQPNGKGLFVPFARCERSRPELAVDKTMCDLLEKRPPRTSF